MPTSSSRISRSAGSTSSASTRPHFARENEELLAFRRQLEGASAPELAPWDISYYSEKLRQSRYDFDQEALRPYFSVDGVLKGMFTLVERPCALLRRRLLADRQPEPVLGVAGRSHDPVRSATQPPLPSGRGLG